MSTSWQGVVSAKLAIRDEILQKHLPVNSVEVSNITTIDDIEVLTQQLKLGRVSAQDVIRAYISQ